MKQRDFSFLAEHFNFETFELTPEHRLTNYIFKELKDSGRSEWPVYQDIKYACVFKEMSTDEVLYSFPSPSPIDIEDELRGYNFYLKLLPSLSLADVALFFAVEWGNKNLYENIFKTDESYPSEFAAELLKETYGNVLFYEQFTTLLAACLPARENTYQDRNEYRLAFNVGRVDKLKNLETMTLPDGVNLVEFLLKYTVNKNNGADWYGFIGNSTHKLAYNFITRAKKYL